MAKRRWKKRPISVPANDVVRVYDRLADSFESCFLLMEQFNFGRLDMNRKQKGMLTKALKKICEARDLMWGYLPTGR